MRSSRPVLVGFLVPAALAAALSANAPVAEAAARADLAVTQVKGAPASALSGGKVTLRARVTNAGKATSKASQAVVRLAVEAGGASAEKVGRGSVAPLAAGRSASVRLSVRLPVSTQPGRWRLVVCVPPGKQANDCLGSSTVNVGDGSTWGRIQAARAIGRLTPGQALLYGLYALSGDRRLPRAFQGPGDVPSGEILSLLGTTFGTLPAEERAALAPYLIQPRYRESAWAPSSGAPVRASAVDPDPCLAAKTVNGAWKGVESTHAWFWYRPDRPAAAARARTLAGEFEKKIWPKLTDSFKTVDDAAGAGCDPVGDSRIDVYLVAPGSEALKTPEGGQAGGVTPPSVDSGDGCGPLPSFVIIPEGAKRAALAHEFMHVIQWAYRACQRPSAWVEGTAAWAMDFVYPKDQDEHEWKSALTTPFTSMLTTGSANGYSAWAFWYSLAKREDYKSVKRVFEALATHDFAGALEAGPSDGLREAWKRYAVERWNDTPIGANGFSVAKSYRDKSWDSFSSKPGGVPDTKVEIGAATTKTFELDTSNQAPLSTWFNNVEIGDKRVRELKFENADFHKPGAVVQAFLKLANGRWRLEDWTDRKVVSLCRDRAEENVVRVVVASSNASARGEALGVVQHKVVAKNRCGFPQRFDGTWTEITTNPNRGSWTQTVRGSATFELNPSLSDDRHGQYDLTSNSMSWVVSGEQRYPDGTTCTFRGSGTDSPPAKHPTGMTLDDVTGQPGAPNPEPKPFYYSIWDYGDETARPSYTITCSPGGVPYEDQVVTPYLHLGHPAWNSGVQNDIQKSDKVEQLEGHRVRPQPDGSLPIDEEWLFTGSG